MNADKSRDVDRKRDGRAEGRSLRSRPAQLLHAADRLQQRSPVLAVAVATWKKFSDNQAGNLAALIAYYAFASLFPLLLVAYSVLDIISRNNAKLGQRLTQALRPDLIDSHPLSDEERRLLAADNEGNPPHRT